MNETQSVLLKKMRNIGRGLMLYTTASFDALDCLPSNMAVVAAQLVTSELYILIVSS